MNHASEKSALVLELGSKLVKCGLSEERAPRVVLRWEVADMMRKPLAAAAWHAYLSSKLRAICFDHLHVNPSHRRFVVCEELAGPRAFRDALLDVLFAVLHASSVALVPAPLVALYATPQHTALVVDCGWAETRVLPVFKSIAMPQFYAPIPTGSAVCCEQIIAAMRETNAVFTLTDAEDVLERACFAQQQDPITNVVDAEFQTFTKDALVVPAHVRTDAVEHLFVGNDVTGASIVLGLLDVVKKLPVDVRAAMLANVLLIGGTAMVPGVPQRVIEELRAALAGDNESTSLASSHEVPQLMAVHFPRNMLAWVGASIFAATESARSMAISASDYTAKGQRLSDWLSIATTSE